MGTTSLERKIASDAAIRGYAGLPGRLAQFSVERGSRFDGSISLVQAGAPDPGAVFPAGVVARTIDDAGRIRPLLELGSLADTFGWCPGVLSTVIVDGWIVLTQRREHIGAARGRSSHFAGFTVTAAGVERVCLRPAHLAQLGLAAGGVVIGAPIPDTAALVLVNPMQLAAHAPRHVRTVLGIEPAPHLSVVDDTQPKIPATQGAMS